MCGVAAYSSPGLPSPATRNIPAYFFLPFSARRGGRFFFLLALLDGDFGLGNGGRGDFGEPPFFLDTDHVRDHRSPARKHANAVLQREFETRMVEPIISSVTSTSNWFGMSSGMHSISMVG